MKTFTPAWELYNANLKLVWEHSTAVVYLFLLPSLVSALGNIMLGSVENNGTIVLSDRQVVGIALLFTGALWQLINLGPATYFVLRASKSKSDSISDYYKQGLRFTWRLVLYYLLFVWMAIIGLILFIVPGIYVIRRYILAPYYLVDKDLGVLEAMSRSAKRSKTVASAIWSVLGVIAMLVLTAIFAPILLSYPGIIVGQLILASFVFLLALRYREIERT